MPAPPGILLWLSNQKLLRLSTALLRYGSFVPIQHTILSSTAYLLAEFEALALKIKSF